MRLISPNQPVSAIDEIRLETAAGFIKLIPYSEAIIRVRFAAHPEFGDKPSLMILPDAGMPTALDVRETAEALIVSTAKLSIRIDRQTGTFTFLDSSRQLLTEEPDRGGKTLTPVDVVKSVFDETAESAARHSVDGVRIEVSPSRQIIDRQAFHTRLAFEWAPGEALYGLGSHEEGMMNLRG